MLILARNTASWTEASGKPTALTEKKNPTKNKTKTGNDWVAITLIMRIFGKHIHLLSCWELDEIIHTGPISTHCQASRLQLYIKERSETQQVMDIPI